MRESDIDILEMAADILKKFCDSHGTIDDCSKCPLKHNQFCAHSGTWIINDVIKSLTMK